MTSLSFAQFGFPRKSRYVLLDEKRYVAAGEPNTEQSEQDQLLLRDTAYTRRAAILSKIILALAIFLAGVAVGGISALKVRENTTWTLGKSPYPVFSRFPKAVVRMPEFLEPASPKSDALWDSGIPYGIFYHLPDGQSRYGLKQGMPDNPYMIKNTTFDTYGMTWTHEYHCLAHVRRDFWDLIYGESDLVHQRGHVKELDVDRQNRIGHNAHCMDYIRQLIVCRGDTTPEPHSSKPLGNGYPYQLDGYDTIHQCIDIDSVIAYMGENLADAYQVPAASLGSDAGLT